MNKTYIIAIIVIIFFGITSHAQIKTSSDLLSKTHKTQCVIIDTVFENVSVFKGKYFSNNTPGSEPLIFGKGLVDPQIHQFHSPPIFSPDYNEMYFSMYLNYDDPQCIFISKKAENIWQKPKLVSFSGQYSDGRPILSQDGKTLFFYSKRPIHEGDTISENSMIWFVKKKDDAWGVPQLLSFCPSLGVAFYPDHYASDGIFYFSVKVASGDYDLYQCEIENDKPINVKRLDEPISMKNIVDLGAATNPQNNILIFQSNNRNNKGRAILYASKKQINGDWSVPVPLLDKINQGTTRFASFTRDGEFFFFANSQSGVEQIYWIKSSQLFSN